MSITDEQIHAALLAFDKDGDGRLMPNEVIMSQLSLGILLPPNDRQKFEQSVSGPMDYKSAASLIKSVTAGRSPAVELSKLFATFDAKNDGTISEAELKAVFQNLGELLSPDQIETITTRFSSNDRINYKELINYLLS